MIMNKKKQFVWEWVTNLCFLHFINPFREIRVRLQQSTQLLSPTIACWVFSCFRNPPYSNMLVRACVRIHTGVWHTDESAHFWLRKTCAPDETRGTRTPVMHGIKYELESDALPIEPPRHQLSHPGHQLNHPFTSSVTQSSYSATPSPTEPPRHPHFDSDLRDYNHRRRLQERPDVPPVIIIYPSKKVNDRAFTDMSNKSY